MKTTRRVSNLCNLVILCAGLLATFISSAAAPISPGDFEAANKLYDQGRFTEAASAYQKLLETGHASAALYFNLGNAWYKSRQIGRAIAAYRKAEQISPRDPDIRANLQFARNQVQGPTLLPGWWQRWLGRLNLNEWSFLAAVSFWSLFLLLALQQWIPSLKGNLRSYITGLAVFTVCCGACFALAFQDTRITQRAVVVSHEAIARQGPLEESNQAFKLQDGAELQVLDRKDDWLQVTAGPRRIGWVRQNLLLLTAPSPAAQKN